MSVELGYLCGAILEQHFGETVKIVGQDLFSALTKSLYNIVKSTNLTKNEVNTRALSNLTSIN